MFISLVILNAMILLVGDILSRKWHAPEVPKADIWETSINWSNWNVGS